jgi:hypothetical protein
MDTRHSSLLFGNSERFYLPLPDAVLLSSLAAHSRSGHFNKGNGASRIQQMGCQMGTGL